jgi:hypothetical protein
MIEYIYCINSGRSGSGYINRLFDTLKSCKSVHESHPICNRLPMINYLNGETKELLALMPEKIDSI